MFDLSSLQHEKAKLERERDRIVAAIHELRQRARQKSLEASSTRVPLPETEVQYWKSGIAKAQVELMEIQSKLGKANKALRKATSDHGVQRQRQPIRTLSQLPREVAGKKYLDGAQANGTGIQLPGDMKEGYVLFLQFFRQLVVENIDPRLIEVFERDAHSLVNDHRHMHGGGDQ